MLTKYEELKIASIILGKSMKELCDAESSKIREACLDSNADPELTKKIDEAINEANERFNNHYGSKLASHK